MRTEIATHLSVLAAALVLDRLLGDPPAIWRRLPHPVVVIGRAIGALDLRLNDERHSPAARRRIGAIAIAALAAGGLLLGYAVAFVCNTVPGGFVAEVTLVTILLAQKSLIDHVSAVERPLGMRDLAGAREAVSRIVGRDVTALDECGIARAAIESAAENFSDAVVAPALWYGVLGLPGLLLFKVVNTADSMIGHRSPRYEAFGWAAARLDDVMNVVPARVSALLLAMAALPLRRAGAALGCSLQDASKHRSPNAGWPEAATAGALGIALGGPRRYGELEVDGAWLNAGGRMRAGAGDIRAAMRLVDSGWAVLLALTALVALVFSR